MGIFDLFKPDVEELEKKRDVEGLIKALQSKDENIRRKAAEAFTEIKDTRATEPLIIALNDKDLDVRKRATEALGNIGDARAVEPLIQALKDKDNGVRREAAVALGEMGDKRAVEPLIQALNDENWLVRERAAAILALEKIGKPAVEPLIRALKDDDVRWGAVMALEKIGKPAVEPLIRALKDDDVRWGAVEALEKIGKPAVEPLFQALKDKDDDVRLRAAEAIEKIGDERAAKLIEVAYRPSCSRTTVKMEAEEALINMGKLAVESLIQALKDKDDDVRRKAAEVLGKIGDKRAVEPLIQALKDENWRVRGEAAAVLGKIRDARAVEPLIQALNKNNQGLNLYAHRVVEALEKIGDARVVEPLIQALKDDSSYVRGNVAEYLGKIKDTRAVEPLIQVLKDEEKENRWKAAEALGKIGDKRAVEPLISAMVEASNIDASITHIQNALANIGELAVEPLIQTLKDNPREEDYIHTLAKIGDKRAAEAVINLIFKDRAEDWAHGGIRINREDMKILFGSYANLIINAAEHKCISSENNEDYKCDYTPNFEAIEKLCEIHTQISNNILHQITQLRDISVSIACHGCSEWSVGTLSFEQHRMMARAELILRGNPPYDPSAYLD